MLGWHSLAEFQASTFMFGVSSLALITVLTMAAAHPDPDPDAEVPPGRRVAIIPAYNEKPESIYATVEALLFQTLPMDLIIVVDDGSAEVIPPYEHPKVKWVRTKNQGKRKAQITGLGDEIYKADFIFTVDSDSIVHARAADRLMRAFDDARVMAATGLQVVKNRTESLWTRVTDLEMVYGEMTIRKARSTIGAVCPCGGALSVYRGRIFADNVEDYLTSGTFSDDRRLAHYGLLAGRVVSVHDAVVETAMPATPKAAFKQRVRWFKGAWKYAPWEAANLRGAPRVLRLWNFAMWIAYPAVMAWSLIALPVMGQGVNLTPFLYWVALLYIQSATYIVTRPRMGLTKRFGLWLVLVPFLSLWQLIVIRPAMYWALTQVRNESWNTRQVTVASPTLVTT
jgi:hyaluronan synthase